jgi:hypothetical protein
VTYPAEKAKRRRASPNPVEDANLERADRARAGTRKVAKLARQQAFAKAALAWFNRPSRGVAPPATGEPSPPPRRPPDRGLARLGRSKRAR